MNSNFNTLQLASINSGSNGNCYYVGNAEDAVLIDVGIAARNVEKRMKLIGLDIKKVKAIFVSHEHSDHIKGLATLAHRHFIPIYVTSKTAEKIHLIKHMSMPFVANEKIEIGSLTITPFFKHHDAVDAHSFTVSCNNINVGIYTDIGTVCSNLIKHFKTCHAAFLEANYDDQMLEEGNYPWHLKNRIKGSEGHLSNQQALDLFKLHANKNLSLLILSHLSKENNNPTLVKELFEQNKQNTKIVVADRYNASDVYEVSATNLIETKSPFQLAIFR